MTHAYEDVKKLAEKIHSFDRFSEKAKINFFEIEKRFSEFEKRLDSVDVVQTDGNTEHRLKEIEHVITFLENKFNSLSQTPRVDTNLATEQHGGDFLDKIRALEIKLSNIEEKTERDINKVEIDVSERVANQKELLDKVESIKQTFEKNIEQIDILRNDMHKDDDTFVKKDDFEKFAAAIGSRISGDETNMEKAIVQERSIDMNLVRIEEKINEYLDKINKSFDSRVIEMEEKLELALKNVPRADQLEHAIQLNVMKLLTQKLEKFAEILDHKFAHFVPAEEFNKQIVRMDGRIATIEVPNIYPLVKRIDDLELKIADLSQQIGHAVDRIPLVVE